MKEYILKPIMTPKTVSPSPRPDKLAVVRNLPPRQPLPTAVIDPAKPMLKLGLDVHLDFIMAVGQKDHANPHAPRKFAREQLVAQVKKWVGEGFQVCCVQESCGFGFVLHRELVAASAKARAAGSFWPTPSAAWPIAVTARFPSIAMRHCHTGGGARATGRNSPRSIPGCWGCWPNCGI